MIEYTAVAKLGIPSAQAHLQAAFPDGIALETAFVAPELVQHLDGAVEEALGAEHWCGRSRAGFIGSHAVCRRGTCIAEPISKDSTDSGCACFSLQRQSNPDAINKWSAPRTFWRFQLGADCDGLAAVRVDVQPLLPSVLTGADAAVLLAASPAVQAAQSAYAGSRASTAMAAAAAPSIPRGWRC